MRIIAGKYKNRKLCVPEDDSVRPTSSRMREAMFNILMHGEFGGKQVIDARVADLCCGTGALGFEALSRGATHCSFVDASKKSLSLVEKTATSFSVGAACQIIHAQATKLPAAGQPYDLIFCDPPYDTPILAEIYASLKQQNWLKAGTLIVTELPAFGVTPPVLEGAEEILQRRYGKAALHVWQIVGANSGDTLN